MSNPENISGEQGGENWHPKTGKDYYDERGRIIVPEIVQDTHDMVEADMKQMEENEWQRYEENYLDAMAAGTKPPTPPGGEQDIADREEARDSLFQRYGRFKTDIRATEDYVQHKKNNQEESPESEE